ncbi:MAG: hypothetical protein OXM60_00340 [Defluviicoccus sp.]|nr:hypothetical protein [Defluviicoccus sp.]
MFERGAGHDREANHLTRAPDAMDRGLEVAREGQDGQVRERQLDRGAGREVRREREREHRIARETGQDRDGKSAARSTERERSGKESGAKEAGLDRGGESGRGVSRESELEKAAGAKQKSRDFDMGM